MSNLHLEWIYTLELSEYQETPCSKQAQYLKFKGMKRDLNLQARKTQSFPHADLLTGSLESLK